MFVFAQVLLLACSLIQVRLSAVPAVAPPRSTRPFDAQAVTREIGARMGSVRGCYQLHARLDPGLGGKVQLGFSVGTDGSITATKVEADTTHSHGLARCIGAQAMTWKVAAAPSAGAYVSYSFVFQGGAR